MRAKKTEPTYTLQELAAAANMTVRNVRAYQTRGLIPAPARRGRHSIYNETHLARLAEIREARARGATLALIGAHLSQRGSLEAEGLDTTWLPRRGGTRPAPRRSEAQPKPASLSNLLSRADSNGVSETVDRLVEAGVLHRNGQRVVAERALATGVNSLVRRGVPVEQALDVAAAAVQAGRTVCGALGQALAVAPGDDRAKRELLDLAAHVLSTVVTIDLADAERKARLVGSDHLSEPS